MWIYWTRRSAGIVVEIERVLSPPLRQSIGASTLVEPFLGPLERLREVAGRYRKGEITHDEGKEQLRKIDVAYAVAVEHPEMSVRQVAAEVGCSVRTAHKGKVFTETNSLPEKVNTAADESEATGLSTATIYR